MTNANARKPRKSRLNRRVTLFDAAVHALLILIVLLCFLPFLYVFIVSFTDPSVYVPLEFQIIPKKFSFDVYWSILNTNTFLRTLGNTVYVTVIGTALSIFTTFTFAYGLSKKEIPFHRVFVAIVLFGLLFNPGMIPEYMNIRSLGLLNNHWSLILSGLISSWNVVIARNFIQGIPGELEEAAKIDGCSYFGTFFHIILPLSTASLATQERFDQVRASIALCNETIERGKNEIIELLNQKGSVKSQQQRFDMMLEQANIRNAQLNQRKLRAMSEEADLASVIQKNEQMLFALEERMEQMQEAEQDFQDRRKKARQGMDQARSDLEQTAAQFHKTHSRLETLRNIAERYDGYGGSIRRVMEQKEKEPGIHGVVADLLTVEKKYETAIETALGGSIENVVTKDEGTAKRIVQFLKENKYGRATFLPLTSVNGRKQGYNERALDAEGVIGMANTLVKTKPQYEGVMAYLLGRIFVVDQIDHAVALAREYHYSLNIVTLEGEHLLPGGSISGGAFKNSSNLLGRKREIDELKAQEQDLLDQRKRLEDKIREYESMQQLLRKEQEKNQEVMQQAYLEHNTAKLNLERVLLQKQESGKAAASLAAETKEIEQQKQQIGEECSKIAAQLKELADKESRIKEQTQTAQKELEEHLKSEQEYTKGLSEIQVEEAALKQQAGFVQENIRRTDEELQKLEKEMSDLLSGAKDADADVTQKELEIEKLRQRIAESETKNAADETELEEEQKRREAMTARQKGFFAKQEELSEHKNVLDKEIFRLLSQKEKLEEAKESQTNYMWSEYELTPHHALKLRDTRYADPSKTKSHIRETKEEIRKLGDVNVNAIEEYKEVSQRYEFLKTQHDDLIQAEQTLLGIIEELDTGMRRQFAEKFAEIQREFDKAFKQLFGGGKGTLELAEDEEILECGISIIAHPPGKKLQNMMQLSGGEKALTAIALLFAIQNLKPSPFCLLDEIEAALDDSNVDRFAKYLHKLTKNTQFIVITHRRGTMTAADRLYGITMQEKGVSTLVSVSLIENDLS